MDSKLHNNKRTRYRKKKNFNNPEPTPDELLRIVDEADRHERDRVKNDERIAREIAGKRDGKLIKGHGVQLFDYLKIADHVAPRARKNDKNIESTRIVLSLTDLGPVSCLICSEEPKTPIGCLHCLKFLGCLQCVKRWEKTTNKDTDRQDGLGDLFVNNDNHHRCFLCRAKWNSKCVEFCYYE
uniref:RING-type domain-containing protein n=1 Tax=Rhabditophanes sp. KR3021 TaxID=114890 RepID=A0AC35TW49_9BILA